MLAFLERANLFLVPLDEERRTYRLHDLFREALLSVLHTTQPEMEPVLHRRAADFYEAEGQWHEAIAHALAAADFSTAVRLMEQTVEPFWLHGEAATMARWVLALPEVLVREHARLVLTAALYLLHPVMQTDRGATGKAPHRGAAAHGAGRSRLAASSAMRPTRRSWLHAQAPPLAPSIWRPARPRRPCCIGVCACYARGWPCMRR